MGSALTAIVSVTIVLGVMILVHEWGHFIAAKYFGVRVEIFSMGFGPRLWGRKRGDTDYRLSALPFGGYVKMAGDNPTEQRSGAPDEFLSKPRWQRVVIAVAGPSMNVLLAILLMAGLFKVGAPEPAYLSQPAIVAGVLPDSAAAQAGISVGDRIIRVNESLTPHWEDAIFETDLASPGRPISVTLERNGETRAVDVPARTSSESFQGYESVLGYPKEPVLIERVTPGMPAAKAGVEAGDEVLTANGEPIANTIQLARMIRSSGGKPVALVVHRAGQEISFDLRPTYGDPGDGQKRWELGIQLGSKSIKVSYSLGDSFRRSIAFNVSMTRQIWEVLAGLFSGRVSLKQLEGPVGIARASGQAARRGPLAFFNLMAVISLNLGLLNLLPIPILDGGHVALLAIEGLLRRDLSVVVKERIVQAGLVFLLGVFAFVMYSDILKLIQNH